MDTHHLSHASAPLKKRSKMISSNNSIGSASSISGDNETRHKKDERSAAAVLTKLATLNQQPPVNSTESSSGHTSDSDSSVASIRSIPRAVHRPPVSNMMVDHTYTDYSVVKENLLSYLNNDEDHDSDSETEDEKRTKEKAIRKIRKIFGDISPTRKNSGGVVKPFPEKLMEVLDRGDMDNIITWLPHGRAFIVRHAQQLREVVLPRFFKQSKFMSFTRQLNLWGFKRITKGTDGGAYYHELFLRGRPLLSMLMRRQKIKGTGIKLTPNPDTEPNFYKISKKRPLPPAASDNKKLQPLPPISSIVSISKHKQNSSGRNAGYNNSSIQNNIDLYLQQQLEQKGLNEFSRSQYQMDQQSPSHMGPGRLMHGMAQQRLSLQDPYNSLDMFQQEPHGHRPFQRLSAPTTQTDLNLVASSIANKPIGGHSHSHSAIDDAQRLLREVSGHQSVQQDPVEELKQKLLNAVQSLENHSQTSSQMEQQQFNSNNLLGGLRSQSMGGGGHQGGFQNFNQYQSMMQQPPQQQNNYFSQQQQRFPQQQQNLFSQGLLPTEPQQQQGGTSMAALMSALDQTRQVAAAAQAQNALLQRVAQNLAFDHRKK